MPTVTRATPADFLSIAALDRLAWPQVPDTFIPDGEHIWRIWVEYSTVLVAHAPDSTTLPESGHVAGALVMFPTEQQELFLHKILVHPDCRGAGLGTALMQTALAQATAPVLLTVDPHNAPAVRLYEKFGFVVRERIDGFYRPHEDRYIMVFTPPAD